jgi:hypothetical protein
MCLQLLKVNPRVCIPSLGSAPPRSSQSLEAPALCLASLAFFQQSSLIVLCSNRDRGDVAGATTTADDARTHHATLRPRCARASTGTASCMHAGRPTARHRLRRERTPSPAPSCRCAPEKITWSPEGPKDSAVQTWRACKAERSFCSDLLKKYRAECGRCRPKGDAVRGGSGPLQTLQPRLPPPPAFSDRDKPGRSRARGEERTAYDGRDHASHSRSGVRDTSPTGGARG